jgi:hypothetical protein
MIDLDRRTVLASVAVTATYFVVTAIAIALTSSRWSDVCWPPRIGGLEVGIAVLLQGYMYARRDEFQRVIWTGRTVEQTIMHIANCLALFGTILWTFGDILVSSALGVPVSCSAE